MNNLLAFIKSYAYWASKDAVNTCLLTTTFIAVPFAYLTPVNVGSNCAFVAWDG